MDSGKLFEKLKGHKKALYTGGKILGAGVGLVVLVYVAPFMWTQFKVFLHSSAGEGLRNVAYKFENAVESVQQKADVLKHSEQENERLRLENANLRVQLENGFFDCRTKDASSRTGDMQLRLSKETGARVGRTLASIYYRPPMHLLPPQLYTLALSYFKAGEDEKAGVILTFLTGLEENNAYKNSKNYLMTGISWYRLANYELADAYFDQALEMKEGTESLPYLAQARLWKGLSAEKLGKHSASQQWLRELVDYHPQSTEAAWVNSREVRRVPSAVDKQEE